MEKTANPIRRFAKTLGPGMIWAMAAIGQTHVVLATQAGAKFGFSLLWVIVVAHILTYPVFDYGPRYAVATGESLIDAYTSLKRIRKFMIFFFGFLLMTVPFLITSSLLSVTASVLHAAWSGVPFAGWCVIITVFTGALAIAGRYKGLEIICIAMSGVLLVATIVAFCLRLPNPSDLVTGAIKPVIPAASIVTLVALMRMPTDAATSIMHSVWAVKKRDEWICGEGLQAGLRRSLLDLRVGFVFSLLIAVIFLSLAAVVLNPLGIDLEGVELAKKLSRIYTDSLGQWTFPIFIGLMFMALWGSFYANIDGVPRMVEQLWLSTRKSGQSGAPRLRITYMVTVMLGGMILSILAKDPLFLLLLAIPAGFIAYPMIYVLNIYAVTKMIDKEFRPSRLNLTVAWLGVVYVSVGSVMFLLVRVLGLWN
jgi:Mn2+/Fe2+ NRAMP family transporter